MKYEFPAIFTREDDGTYSVDFPDVEGCYTCGDDLNDAATMAHDVLKMVLKFRSSNGLSIPAARPDRATLPLKKNQDVYMIAVDIDDNYISETCSKCSPDPVNHPSYYESECSLECIDVMMCCFDYDAVFNFCVCNAFKYLWRHKFKNGSEDLKKAAWYINRAEKIMDDTGDYEHLSNQLTRIRVLYESVTKKEEKNGQSIDSE